MVLPPDHITMVLPMYIFVSCLLMSLNQAV